MKPDLKAIRALLNTGIAAEWWASKQRISALLDYAEALEKQLAETQTEHVESVLRWEAERNRLPFELANARKEALKEVAARCRADADRATLDRTGVERATLLRLADGAEDLAATPVGQMALFEAFKNNPLTVFACAMCGGNRETCGHFVGGGAL